ncbi:hypothetical protein UFOVP330_51 [uncultured Caudovirales phage]|uniref:Uncharacterized protein n=1 Tax=uncultured Caudovirales phage TaxID=2100421 RepID=A0A6J5LVF3_9CAUD|nr:hypothetical protein UFOVP330_51 [uncultured Caudovirales phage]
MPFTGNFLCTSFKQQLLEGVHDFRTSGTSTFKIALYTNAATFDASTTQYTTTDEIAPTGSYVAGGGTLTLISPSSSGTTAFADFADITFTGATITARGALIYNATPAHTYTNPAVAVLDFGQDRTVTSNDFTVVFPLANALSALVRIS